MADSPSLFFRKPITNSSKPEQVSSEATAAAPSQDQTSFSSSIDPIVTGPNSPGDNQRRARRFEKVTGNHLLRSLFFGNEQDNNAAGYDDTLFDESVTRLTSLS